MLATQHNSREIRAGLTSKEAGSRADVSASCSSPPLCRDRMSRSVHFRFALLVSDAVGDNRSSTIHLGPPRIHVKFERDANSEIQHDVRNTKRRASAASST